MLHKRRVNVLALVCECVQVCVCMCARACACVYVHMYTHCFCFCFGRLSIDLSRYVHYFRFQVTFFSIIALFNKILSCDDVKS